MKVGMATTAVLLLAGLAVSSATAQQMGTRPVITAPPAAGVATGQPSAVPMAGATGAIDPNYVIGPSDSLEVNVFNEPKFSGTLPVRPDGMISIPLIGDILASGYTPMQLGTEITSRLKTLITDPRVTVSVLAINSKHIYLVGEVGHVGPMAMTPGMTPLQAIATAGGLGQYANEKKIYILRTSNGKQEKIPFNYKKAIKYGDMQGVSLQNGDTIVIP